MVMIQRVAVAKVRQRSSAHQSLRTRLHVWALVDCSGSSVSRFASGDGGIGGWLRSNDSLLEAGA